MCAAPSNIDSSEDVDYDGSSKKPSSDLSFPTDSSNGSTLSADTSLTSEYNFTLYTEEDDVCGFGHDLKAVAGNPRKLSEGLETYLSYKIFVTSTRPEFPEKEYVVYRRYNDFVWLRNKLVENYQTHIIPPLPNKHSLLGQLDRYSKEFVKYRIVMLNRFLSRIIKHPILSHNEQLKIFLTASSTEFSAHLKNDNTLFNKFSSGISNLTVIYSSRDTAPEFVEIRKYVNNLGEKLISLEKIICRITKERKELCSEMQHLSREFEKWSCVEPTLGPLLSAISFALNVNSMHREEHLVKPIHNIVLQPAKEYLLYIDSIKEALNRRDAIQAEYESSLQEVEKKKYEKESVMNSREDNNNKFSLWRSTNESKEEKLESLAAITPKLISLAEANQDKLEVANENLRSDFDRWTIEEKNDVKCVLVTLSDRYIQYYQKALNTWEEILNKINQPM